MGCPEHMSDSSGCPEHMPDSSASEIDDCNYSGLSAIISVMVLNETQQQDARLSCSKASQSWCMYSFNSIVKIHDLSIILLMMVNQMQCACSLQGAAIKVHVV